ncbi:unnamed protein product [Jaminaea pallidilutea]
MPPRVPLHRTASSSSVASQHSNSGARQTGTSNNNAAATYASQGTPPPPPHQQRNARHLAYDFDGPHSPASQPNGSRLRPSPSIHSPSSSSLQSNYHTQANHQAFSSPPRRNINADTDDVQGGQPRSFEYRKNYEDDSELLPTHSPVASPAARYRSHTNDSNGYGPTFSSNSPKAAGPSGRLLASATHQPSRLAGSFNPYSDNPAEVDVDMSGVEDSRGESKYAEKVKANGLQSVYGRAGLAPIEKGQSPASNGTNSSGTRAPSGSGKYASMLPEQAPPQSPFEHVAALFDNEHFCTAMYFVLSLITRLYRIGKSNTVIWDEAHFGKFGSHYLKHEFYFDVHPPLGKMLVGLAGAVSGYNGSFEFKSGESYPEETHYYVGMRVILAMFGVVMVPVAWRSSSALGWNKRSRHLLAMMVLCDNAWLVISRFILLDSMLLCFTFTTVHGLLMFHQQQNRPFSEKWWFWLTFTGLSIGCVASVKWVGLFVMALVGLYTVEDLWDKFGDLRMPVRTYVRHWCARGLCLIAIPAAVYMLSFKLHFLILSHSGPGDAQMSSLFQAHLRGNDFAKNPLEAAYGSKATFKNMGYGGGLLHSHVQTYPVGSQQQQVTCYHYQDNNNEFVITPTWEDEPLPADPNDESVPLRMLKNGDTVRLVHASTGRNLHSHKVAAPITKENYEVSGYGNATVGDANDYWVVEVVDDMHLGRAKPGMNVRSLTTRIRFRHKLLNCYLRAANAILPQWGWKQVEVSCDKENNTKDDHTYWNIESHWNSRLPSGDTKLYKSPFLRDFIHLNVAMMTSNNALVPDADKEDILASKPYDWPFLWNGLRMSSWADASTKYYLIGNPVIWWGSSIAIGVYILTFLWYLARMQRRHADLSPADFNQFVFVGKVGFFGWFLHYLPFLVMARVCYIHHYLPTLYFATILFAHILDHFFFNASTARYKLPGANSRRPLTDRTKNIIFLVCALAIVGTFAFFHRTALGIDGPVWKYRGRRWRKNWNIYD